MKIKDKEWNKEILECKNYLRKLLALPKTDLREKIIKKTEHQILCLENRRYIFK